MKENDYTSLFASLNDAVEILHRNRRADPAFIAAFDTLKQSRAMLVNALNKAPGTITEVEEPGLVAA